MYSAKTNIDIPWATPPKIRDILFKLNGNCVPTDAEWTTRDPEVGKLIVAAKLRKAPKEELDAIMKRSQDGVKSPVRPAELVMLRTADNRKEHPVRKQEQLSPEQQQILAEHTADGELHTAPPPALSALDGLKLPAEATPPPADLPPNVVVIQQDLVATETEQINLAPLADEAIPAAKPKSGKRRSRRRDGEADEVAAQG